MPTSGEKHFFSLLLCDIRSAQNAGAIMRTADALGVFEVILGGYTPGPLDRFGREHKAFSKASLGAEHSVKWRHAPELITEIQKKKKEGYCIVAIEQSKQSIDYKKVALPPKPILVLLGNEVEGISSELLALSDIVAELPMKGKKESLNVSVAAGAVLFRWFDR
jgi:23S rRNA (guanosine2251-2'-O)-methyltransferase